MFDKIKHLARSSYGAIFHLGSSSRGGRDRCCCCVSNSYNKTCPNEYGRKKSLCELQKVLTLIGETGACPKIEQPWTLASRQLPAASASAAVHCTLNPVICTVQPNTPRENPQHVWDAQAHAGDASSRAERDREQRLNGGCSGCTQRPGKEAEEQKTSEYARHAS